MSSTRPPDATPVCPRCSASLFGARALARSAPQDTGDLRPKGRAPNAAAERQAEWPDRSLRKHSCLPPSGLAWPSLAQSGSAWFTIADLALWRSGTFRLSVAQNASPRFLALWRSGSIRLSLAQNASRAAQSGSECHPSRFGDPAQSGSVWLRMPQSGSLSARSHTRAIRWRKHPPRPDGPPSGCHVLSTFLAPGLDAPASLSEAWTGHAVEDRFSAFRLRGDNGPRQARGFSRAIS